MFIKFLLSAIQLNLITHIYFLMLNLFFIKLMSDEGDLVFDPFCGSGTTCLAARDSGRNYLGCDVQQEYVTIARNRLFTCMDSLF